MSIRYLARKIKGFSTPTKTEGPLSFLRLKGDPIPDDIFLGILILLVAFASFGLGRLSKIEGAKTPIRVENAPGVPDTLPTQNTQAGEENSLSANVLGATTDGTLVGSKNGSKYHYPWCAGAQKIAEANRVYFNSKAEAEQAGYTPASNCKGL